MSAGAEDSPASGPRVDFYVVAGAAQGARLRVACRIAEKAYLAGQRVALLCPDEGELRVLDDLLWTFADGSFVPHERVAQAGTDAADCPVVLTAGSAPAGNIEVVVNLGPDLPPRWSGVRRIAEILDGEPARRAAGRTRFRQYRSEGIEPHTHNLEG